MDMPIDLQNIFSFDKHKHNHSPDLYELYKMNPERNSLCFTDTYDKTIVILQINKKINFLNSLLKFYKCEIRCTNYTWMVKLINCMNIENIDVLLEDNTLVYLSINDVIYKNKMMIDKINNEDVYYNPLSFRQSDDSIKTKLYQILKENIKSKKLYLIGGEMIFFAKLLNSDDFYMYTDFQSIYDDAIYNYPDYIDRIKLINYDNDKLNKVNKVINNDYYAIINTSKSGIGRHLCNEILKLGLNNICIISCNRKSFLRDFKQLSYKYTINKVVDLKTNYVVSIYFLNIF